MYILASMHVHCYDASLLINSNRMKCWYINNLLFSLPVGGNYIVCIICYSESAVALSKHAHMQITLTSCYDLCYFKIALIW